MKDNEDYLLKKQHKQLLRGANIAPCRGCILTNNKNNYKQLWHHLKKMQTVFSHLQGGNEVVTGVVTEW